MMRFRIDCGQVVGVIPYLSNAVMGITSWNLLRQGVELQRTLEEITPAPLLRRTMGTLNSGIGIDRGTGVYREDAAGDPHHDFTFIDQILDAIATPDSTPFFGLDFMPEALSSGAEQQLSAPGMRIDRFPPKDLGRWYDLIVAVVTHCLDRFGEAFVSQWYWDFWNEPDLEYYWLGSQEAFFETYDYTAAAVKAALPTAKVGGPGPTDRRRPIFKAFLENCMRGSNYCTGETGTPLDFITFHIKGGATGKLGEFSNPWEAQDYERKHPSLDFMMETAQWVLETVASVPGLEGLPLFFTECDIDWGTGTSIYHNPNMHYRNSEYFAAFQCAMNIKMHNLSADYPDNPIRATFLDTFYSPGQRLFEGQRTLITGDMIDKPILNGLRLLGKLGKQRLAVKGPAPAPVDLIATTSEDGSLRVMAVNFREAFDYDEEQTVRLHLTGMADGSWRCRHYRIDANHSNAYSVWLSQDRPIIPTHSQLATLLERMGVELFEPVANLSVTEGEARLETTLPPHAVSFWLLERLKA
jgi:xylan 1,4-beta-xylosidase